MYDIMSMNFYCNGGKVIYLTLFIAFLVLVIL